MGRDYPRLSRSASPRSQETRRKCRARLMAPGLVDRKVMSNLATSQPSLQEFRRASPAAVIVASSTTCFGNVETVGK